MSVDFLASINFATPWTAGSSVHGIFQARVLEWVAIAFSEARISLPLYSRILRTQHIP